LLLTSYRYLPSYLPIFRSLFYYYQLSITNYQTTNYR